MITTVFMLCALKMNFTYKKSALFVLNHILFKISGNTEPNIINTRYKKNGIFLETYTLFLYNLVS